jgi:hypothetical protein
MRCSRLGDKARKTLGIIQLSDDAAARPQGHDDQRDYEDTRHMAREYRFADRPVQLRRAVQIPEPVGYRKCGGGLTSS